ncbi:replication initiator protein [Microviridae sp.]|nr:replication initiator protein [Microviridae sp.]
MASVGPMACYAPINGFRGTDGRIRFGRTSEAYRDKPIQVPCGRCIGCRLERSRQWAVRIMHESQLHDRNCFLTLTYDDEHLPPGGTLEKSDFQKFARTARKRIGRFRYYQCGEYGETTGRPHHHVCLFGKDFAHDREPFKTTKDGHPLFTSRTLSRLWPLGHAYIGQLTFASAAYVARYCTKKVNGSQAAEHYGDRVPEYSTMSRRPGIGADWINRFQTDVYPSDQVIVNGRATKPPKFYDQQLEKNNKTLHEIIKSQRKAKAEQNPDNTPDRLATREEVSELRAKQWQRDF